MTRWLDVNLLMALLWENHEHHTGSGSWFKFISKGSKGSSPEFGILIAAFSFLGLTPSVITGDRIMRKLDEATAAVSLTSCRWLYSSVCVRRSEYGAAENATGHLSRMRLEFDGHFAPALR